MLDQQDEERRTLDPLQMAEALMQVGMRLQNIFQEQPKENNLKIENILPLNPWHVAQTFSEALTKLALQPEKLAEVTQEYMEDLENLRKDIFESSFNKTLKTSSPLFTEFLEDRRFQDPLWQENPFFKYLKESYLLWNRWMRKVSHSIEGLDKHTAHKIDFYTRQVTDFFAPSNFLWTNPKALRKIIDSGGKSLIQGIENFIRDIEKGHGTLDIKMVDYDAFKLGVNLATTPGKIVFRNDLFELIHYTPIKNQVYGNPLLIVPPCINKYYIFDLRENNSFIRWCLEQGMQVFTISWVNPDETLSHKSFEDYVFEGLGTAVKVIQELTQHSLINAIGYCIGGTILSCYAARQVLDRALPFSSLTYFATLFDFKNSGDLNVFIDEEQLKLLEEKMKIKGYLEGKVLARTFNLLRANDLIWWFVVNNYLLGEEPAAFDLLYWNSDSTNLPADMYIYYLKEIFFKNQLIQSGKLVMKGKPLDLTQILTPTYILNTREDHIAPWHCGYAGTHLFKGPLRFVLGDSGHIAGVFNHPKMQKYRYWTYSFYPENSYEWLKKAQEHPGSWWHDWLEWLTPYLGSKVAAQSIESRKFPPLASAPGTYVMKREASYYP
jgi:polyhydroxyalkanoate synthase